MKSTLLAVLLAAVAGGALFLAPGCTPASPSPAVAAPGPGADAAASALGVDELMRNVDDHRGLVTVEGVVSSATAGTLSLIDKAEFEHCGVTTCADLVLPVRWTGAAPAVRDTVRVKGEVKAAAQADGGKLVFEAVDLKIVPVREAPK